LDFEDSANSVFRGFMISWARKLVIAEALSGIRPQLRESLRRLQVEPWPVGRLPSEAVAVWRSVDKSEFERAVLAIDVFPRCVVLLTVFERLSTAESALLLNTHVDVVKQAQRRGLIELARNVAIGRGWDPSSAKNEIRVKNLRSVLGPLAWPTCTT
jgi:DNA-directed RNA polymerase specialized sigma24 family protein